jgi:hypothetical protein
VRPTSIELPGQRGIATRLSEGQNSNSAKIKASNVASAGTRHLGASQLVLTFETHGFNSGVVIGALTRSET